jgi:hypothetical protein
VSETGGDVTLLLRQTTLLSNSFFDACAPYMDTAVGVYSRLGRRPAPPADDNTILNTAILHAAFRVLNSELPSRAARWRRMLTTAGLDPDDNSTDKTTPVGIGNAAGAAVVAGRANDGTNSQGLIGRKYNPQPFRDYTGYAPVNTPYKLTDPARWQPDIQRKGYGALCPP